MNQYIYIWFGGLLFALFIPFLGCSGLAKNAEVKGEVMLDGQPMKTGQIRFVPMNGKSPAVDASVADGKYAARVPLGEMKVEIRAPKVIGKRKMYDTPDSPTVDDIAERVAARYNDRTELRLTVQAGGQEKTFEVREE